MLFRHSVTKPLVTCASRKLWLLVGLLSLIIQPMVTKAQLPKVQWATFQLDHQLALQLPALPRQLQDPAVTNQQTQSYMALSPQVMWVLVRNTLPVTGPLLDQQLSYARFAEAALAHWNAVEVKRAPFHVGSLIGLELDFRIPHPAPGKPATGTLWVLRVNRIVYVAQWLAQATISPEAVAQKHHFLASWTLTHLPVAKPTAADFARFHVGQFRTVNAELPTTLITRADTIQTETNSALALQIVYGLRWNKVGYDMTQRRSTGKNAALLQPKVIKVSITAVQGNTYWYWATIDGFITTGQLQRIK
jgi:hypothetical protein